MGAISFNIAAPPFSKWVNIYVNRRQLSAVLLHLELSYTFILNGVFQVSAGPSSLCPIATKILNNMLLSGVVKMLQIYTEFTT